MAEKALVSTAGLMKTWMRGIHTLGICPITRGPVDDGSVAGLNQW